MLWLTAVMKVINFGQKFMGSFAQEYLARTGVPFSGTREGFYQFYSAMESSQITVPVSMMDKIFNLIYKHTYSDNGLEYLMKKDEYIRNIGSMKKYSSYRFGQCINSINNIAYSKNQGKLYMSIFTFTPFLIDINGQKVKSVRYSALKINMQFEMAKYFVVLSKVKANWFKGTYAEEIRWLDQKALTLDSVVNAMSIALAPCIVGIVHLPPEFVTQIEIMVKDEAMKEQVAATIPEADNLVIKFNEMKEKQPSTIQPPPSLVDPMSDYADEDVQDYEKIKETEIPNSHPYWRRYRKNHRRIGSRRHYAY